MLPSFHQLSLERNAEMDTLICRTCGCSLVRLGVAADAATMHEYRGEQHPFCCQGCVEVFETDPERYLTETSDLVVCPTCLAEKPIARSIAISIDGHDVHFCRCPRCLELFESNPDFYRGRMDGSIPNDGVLDHNGCCLRPADDSRDRRS